MSGVKELAHRRERRRAQEKLRRRIALGLFVGVDDAPVEPHWPEPHTRGPRPEAFAKGREPLRCPLGELVGAR